MESRPEDAKIIGTRWVHTDKSQKKRLMSAVLQGRTGKSQAQIQKEFPLDAKSRLVVQGHQETDTGIRSDSPTWPVFLLSIWFVQLLLFGSGLPWLLTHPRPISSRMESAACFCSGHHGHLLPESLPMIFSEHFAQSMGPQMPAELGGRSSSKP